MDAEDLYDAHSRERLVAEPPKRVEAPERTAFERDRARVVHAAAFRRPGPCSRSGVTAARSFSPIPMSTCCS